MTADTERAATYREVLAVTEYRAVFGAYILSTIGDMLAKVAVAVLVFSQTGSALMSAAAFAIGYLPWVAGGPVLAAIADRMPWRRTLVLCDVIRVVLVATLAIPGMPLPMLLLILFASALLAPPFEAARSAMLPDILTGDRYVLGIALNNMAAQLSQVLGFVIGGWMVAALSARGALLIDAATFLGSAILLRLWVRERPPPLPPEQHVSLGRETMDGLRLVFGSRVLRVYVAMVWVAAAFAFAPEGLAAPLATELGGGPNTVGLLLAANPVGTIVGGVVVARLLAPANRIKALRPLALLSTAALIPIVLPLPIPAVLFLYFLSGFGMSFLLPLNAVFVRALPISFRARAFGIVQSGLQVSQGITVLMAGWAADLWDVRTVIGISGFLGICAVAVLAAAWPSPREARQAVPEPV